MKYARILFCVVSALLLCNVRLSFAQDTNGDFHGEHIRNFDVVLTVAEDSTVRVQETIEYDFGLESRHGIFRFIPTAISGSFGDRKIRISDVEVQDENGRAYTFERTSRSSVVEFKIGHPDVLIDGVHTYVISYMVSNAIGYSDSFDELYWNATGNKWEVPIFDTHVKVILPGAVASSDVRVACYEGLLGSTDTCESMMQNEGAAIEFFSVRGYSVFEGMTVAVGFPKRIVFEPTTSERVIGLVQDNVVVLLPFMALLGLFIAWYIWGRDPKGRGVIVPHYDVPDKLTPLEIGAIYCEKVRNSDISAEIIYLATQGYLSINYIEEKKFLHTKKDYELVKLRDESEAQGTDRLIMEHLFVEISKTKSFLPGRLTTGAKASVVRISKLKDVFVRYVSTIKKDVFDQVVSGGYYKTSPHTVSIYGIIGGISCGFGLVMLEKNLISGLSFIITGVLIFLFSKVMPAKTEKGMAAYEHILGLREYLRIAEKDRLKFHNAPEKKPEVFEKFLPYAMVLGVEKAWAKEFENIYIPEPSWYHGGGGAFNSAVFLSSMGDFTSISNKTMLASSSGGSGGGGFSGGGGGGGGGGSW